MVKRSMHFRLAGGQIHQHSYISPILMMLGSNNMFSDDGKFNYVGEFQK